MGSFLSCYAQILLLTCVPPVLWGLLVACCRWLFVNLAGNWSGRPLLKAAFLFSTPLREAGHALMAVLFLHRITDIRLLDLHDADGELGFVEHDYNPRNPVALLGNFFYALGPVLLGLFFLVIVFLSCFRGVLGPFFFDVVALGERGAGFGEYVAAAFSLVPAMFTSGSSHVIVKIIGFLLLLMSALGIYVSLAELMDSLSGISILALLAVPAAAVLALFDERVQEVAVGGLRTFAAGVTALFMVVLLASLLLVAVAGVWFLLRNVFVLDTTALTVYRDYDKDDDREY